MSERNETITTVTEFFIVGFPGLQPQYNNLLAAMFFIIYVTVLVGNFVFMVMFAVEASLRKPMYVIMLNLAISDVGFCTVALPKLISRYWFNNGSISFQLCMTQRLFIHYFGGLNCLIMMVMSLDRYLAICFPLRYRVLITNRTMGLLSGFSWATAFITPSISLSLTLKMPFCGPNLIINCFCDTLSINSLACTDTRAAYQVQLSIAMVVLLAPFSFIIFSYASIIVTVVQTLNSQARLKAFSTCASQLCIICLYFTPRFFVYTAPFIPDFKMTVDQRLALSMFYSLLPPLVNPLIYCFRSKRIQQLCGKWCSERKRASQKVSVVFFRK